MEKNNSYINEVISEMVLSNLHLKNLEFMLSSSSLTPEMRIRLDDHFRHTYRSNLNEPTTAYLINNHTKQEKNIYTR